jgi:DNA-binding transcriptional MerR regulator
MENMNDEYFLSINDVSKRLEIPAHTLRYWEKQFPTAVKPTTGAGGRRYYRIETVDALGAIKDLLYNRGMTISGVKKLIKQGQLSAANKSDAAPVKAPAPAENPSPRPHKSDISHAIDLLERARAALQ